MHPKDEVKGKRIVIMILDPIMGSKMLGLRITREENYVIVNRSSENLTIAGMVNA